MRRALQANGLGLCFGLLFLLTLLAQAVAGAAELDEQQRAEGLDRLSVLEYVGMADFAADVAENWQSEFLQFLLFILATVWLVQRGSPESKALDDVGRGSDEAQRVGAYARADSPAWVRAGGWRSRVYSHSLVIVMGTVFLGSWAAQSVAGWSAYSEQQLRQRMSPVSWVEYVASPDFWSRTFQNWQSEFLAVGSMAVLATCLRERGSPESKPVGDPHGATGDSP